MTGKEPKLDHQPMQPGDVPITYADVSKAKSEIGYDPQTNVREGLERFFAWFQSRNNAADPAQR